MKEIYLINPAFGGVFGGFVSTFYRNYPPFFVALKALTPEGYTFKEFNRVFLKKKNYAAGKLVAITCYTANCYEAYKIAKEFKKHGSKVVMGGPHVSYLPEEALTFCDSVILGEAEGIWRQVVEDYERDTLKREYSGAASDEDHQKVHQKLLASPPDVIKEFIEPTRGCKFKCHFCSVPALSDGAIRKKPVREIVELIDKVRSRYHTITLLDNNIYNDPAYAKELFKALKPLDIKWQSFCTIDIAKNEEVLRLAKESGCFMLVIGFEVSKDSAEEAQRGKFAMAKRYLDYARRIKKAGINIRGNFIFGFDSDRYRDLFSLWKFILRLNPTIALMSLLTPMPGTRLYHDMIKDNRLSNLNWHQYSSFRLVFEHPHIKSPVFSYLFFPFVTFFIQLTTSHLGWMLITFILMTYFIRRQGF